MQNLDNMLDKVADNVQYLCYKMHELDTTVMGNAAAGEFLKVWEPDRLSAWSRQTRTE